MRISASGLESTIAVAIDQILRLAPSISPPIEPVVSRTNATSTVGLAMARDKADDMGKAASAKARAGMAMTALMGFPPMVRSWNQVPHRLAVRVEAETRQARTNLRWLGLASLLDGLESVKVHIHGKPRPTDKSRARTGPSSVRDRACDRAR